MKHIREPFNSISHLLGAILGIPGLIILILYALDYGTIYHLISFTIFGISLILLYSASALYHGLKAKESTIQLLRRLDHMMIFFLIAGTYTPICLVTIRGVSGYTMLVTIWLIAIAGSISKVFWPDIPNWLSALIYAAMGCLSISVIMQLIAKMPPLSLGMLIAGGAFYLIGALIYGFQRPDFGQHAFGHHELFHLFVLGGSISHFLMILNLGS